MNIHTLDKRKKEAMCSEPTDDKRVSSFGEHETHIALHIQNLKGLKSRGFCLIKYNGGKTKWQKHKMS